MSDKRQPLTPEAASARQGGLVYVSDTDPGLRRRTAGNVFRYLDARGRAIHDDATLQRIRMLAIPPAYRDVWICPRVNGHLQATGRDARGRKQYRYHPRWAEVRDREKFGRIEAFGAALPRLRRHLRRDLALPGFPEQKVAAMVVAVMADTLVRIGNAGYARANKSYGLTTLRNRHVQFLRGGRARFRFRGKGGIDHDVVLDDAKLARLLQKCQQLPGQHLFQYHDDEGQLHPVGSAQVNDYLRDAMGADFTAKDFRTWGGTLAAIRLLAEMPWDEAGASQRAMAAMRKAVETDVARQLGNTPAVCRKSYIDPRVYAAWEGGWLARASNGVRGPRQWEAVALKLLRRRSK
ncbi:DNA topoisomerase IB [Thermomonas carbonis]|uniref:DNA topoisomerase n=1 Tax=Thermomonas carbonis TaxID=1463158 RepID=A0A7G9SLK2_9GAMM|nr:DNA topoisomerase IB [Thermomonas carbonis]QNN68727.1 DNA topoisomerase IB [Thermomonas carbonis]GHC09233.1 DNA topoisomerase [Thermomonas carbonis]